jgi:hypothetical protein
MRRFNSFLLIFIALWLPLQAAAAVVMPFCRHAAERQEVQSVVRESPAHCHNQVLDDTGTVPTDLGCDNCEMCHLATAGYLPATHMPLPLLMAAPFVAKQVFASPSHISEPPQHPPRRPS